MRLSILAPPPEKVCGLLVFLLGSPKPIQDANQQPSNHCPSTASLNQGLRSPEESLLSLFKVRENASPKAFSLTAVSEPDPIYPYVPFVILTISI
jgi:hypothetical protein